MTNKPEPSDELRAAVRAIVFLYVAGEISKAEKDRLVNEVDPKNLVRIANMRILSEGGLWGPRLDPDELCTVSMWTRQMAHQLGVTSASFRARYMSAEERADEEADPDRLIRPDDPTWTLRRQNEYAAQQMDPPLRRKD